MVPHLDGRTSPHWERTCPLDAVQISLRRPEVSHRILTGLLNLEFGGFRLASG